MAIFASPRTTFDNFIRPCCTTRLRVHGRQTISQLEADTQANRNTLKVRLHELVALGRLRRYGKVRATWYSL
jgi:hypothetical protein